MALHVPSLERIFFLLLCCVYVFLCYCQLESIFFFELKHLHHCQLLLCLLVALSLPPLCLLHLLVACLFPSHLFHLIVACQLLATNLLHVACCLLLLPSLVVPNFACLFTSTIVTYLPPCLGSCTKQLFHCFTTCLLALSFKHNLLLGPSPYLFVQEIEHRRCVHQPLDFGKFFFHISFSSLYVFVFCILVCALYVLFIIFLFFCLCG